VNPPFGDQVEITVFGPGYGECCLVHLGSNAWVIIHSCIDNATGEPAALAYLQGIGVNCRSDVHLIIATHWHDDHIRGLATLVERCETARFCASSALRNEEFLAHVLPFEERHLIKAGSGVSEIFAVLEVLRRAGRPKPIAAASKKPVLYRPAASLDHGRECKITTLSPSDAQFWAAIESLGNLVPVAGSTRGRLADPAANPLSIVAWISLGDIRLLFGGDLEETADPDTGWSAIVNSEERPNDGKAQFFKIPHHGSANGHSDAVWERMLDEHPICCLTPWARARGLPSKTDVGRILDRSRWSFSTSRPVKLLPKQRDTAVQKQVAQTALQFGLAEMRTGAIRLRNGGEKNPHSWCLDQMVDACHLSLLV
jgi:hypothetical protein